MTQRSLKQPLTIAQAANGQAQWFQHAALSLLGGGPFPSGNSLVAGIA
jgi:hypothetical protein